MGRMHNHAGKKGNERRKWKELLTDYQMDCINEKAHLEANFLSLLKRDSNASTVL